MERNSLRYLQFGVVFTFLNIYVGSLNLLPDFVGMLLFYASMGSHRQRTQAEEKAGPLFLLLAADYFLHWLFPFENSLEGVLALIISLYAIYVLFGEVADRIRSGQPHRARELDVLRACAVLLQAASFLLSPWGIGGLQQLLAFLMVGICIALVAVICRIHPQEP